MRPITEKVVERQKELSECYILEKPFDRIRKMDVTEALPTKVRGLIIAVNNLYHTTRNIVRFSNNS